MGYTHYWMQHGDIDQELVWPTICQDVRKILLVSPVPLAKTLNANSLPLIDDNEIVFNGKSDKEGAEDFVFQRTPKINFTFCKTMYQPYDPVVCAVLSVIVFHAPLTVAVQSDGTAEAWQPVIEWASEVLGVAIRNPMLTPGAIPP